MLLAFGVTKELAISNVARVFGLRTSAIRYYEQIGILPPPFRKNGQRRYNDSVLFRLAVVQRARETGFTLDEIRELFFGFPPGTVHRNAGINSRNGKSRNSGSGLHGLRQWKLCSSAWRTVAAMHSTSAARKFFGKLL